MSEKVIRRTDSGPLDSGVGESGEIELPSCCEPQEICFRPSQPGSSRVILCKGTIQQHYYPEGGWGWMIVACGVLVQCLSHGLHLSWSVIHIQVYKYFPNVKTTDLGA